MSLVSGVTKIVPFILISSFGIELSSFARAAAAVAAVSSSFTFALGMADAFGFFFPLLCFARAAASSAFLANSSGVGLPFVSLTTSLM
jgi:hypothetical protein